MKKRLFFILVLFFSFFHSSFGQSSLLDEKTNEEEKIDTGTSVLPLTAPEGFRTVKLGMSVDEVKAVLAEDPFFDYRGEPDVSFLPDTQQFLIECEGFSYI